MTEEGYEEEEFEGTPPQRVDLAYLLGMPIDVPSHLLERYFPFLSKTFHLSNLKNNDILDIQDELELIRIESLKRLRRYELKHGYNREEFLRVRAYSVAALSLSRDGFAINKLTITHKHITYEDERKKASGGFFGFFRRG